MIKTNKIIVFITKTCHRFKLWITSISDKVFKSRKRIKDLISMKYNIKGKKINGNWILKKLYYGGLKDIDLIVPANRYKEIKEILTQMRDCNYIVYYFIPKGIPKDKRGFRITSKNDGLNYIQELISFKEKRRNHILMLIFTGIMTVAAVATILFYFI